MPTATPRSPRQPHRPHLFVAGLLCAIATLAAAQSPDSPGTLRKLKDGGVINLGYRTDSAPFSFVGDDKRPTGYSVELCQEVVGVLRQNLGLPQLRVQWVPVTSATRIEAVVSGQVDLECGTTSATLSRMEKVDFSNLIFVDGTGLLVRSNGGVKRVADLAGRKVAATRGSTGEDNLRRALAQRGITAEVLSVDSEVEGLKAVEAGTVDAYANDRLILIGLGRKAKDAQALGLVDEDISMEPYALMMRQDAAFRVAVNRAISTIYRSPAIDGLYERWFGGFGKPGALLGAMYYLGATPE
ncbi:amino acid ABC transporter substrate-binding protein [Zoogloea sp.]|uniref:amino acid ABC transporter substrate-binding protein n=1 Tax=Zoogloea sp. TaxID=49181 RepID=UPI001D3F51AA|nr:amino acid ABC transporter substrate-binding protein [Zoogloea sp.]MBK6656558.1 amino acid ABC transporter substrate-binding protein [Zoogloea sp.]MBK7846125.1 amino acid ABC transporter substrate-binding protein [Zoogloea sp.]